jgi:hypothetical protein
MSTSPSDRNTYEEVNFPLPTTRAITDNRIASIPEALKEDDGHE